MSSKDDDDDWDVNDSDTDISLDPNKISRATVIKIYKLTPPTEPKPEPEPQGPSFLCTIDRDLPANIVPVGGTRLEETYTLTHDAGQYALKVYAFDTLQCQWDLNLVDDNKTITAWKQFGWTPEKKIFRAWWYEWIDERGLILSEYRNGYSGTKDRGWPEDYYGNNIFNHECKTI